MTSDTNSKQTHFFSIDFEDWYTSAYLRDFVDKENLIDRITHTTQPILDLLDATDTKATFFVLGEIAVKHENLIKQIVGKGHEIASHGYSHTPLWDLNPESFEKEIQDTNRILSDITGKKVKGFRAPYASLDHSTAWAVDVLKSNHFEYDSSIFPMKTPLYGVAEAPLYIYRISSSDITADSKDSELIEIPFTVYQNNFIKIPCTGGIYGRFLPSFLLIFLLKNSGRGQAVNFYFHPWETDKAIPKLKVPLYNNIVSYYNTSNYLKKIEKVLKEFNFTTFEKKLDL